MLLCQFVYHTPPWYNGCMSTKRPTLQTKEHRRRRYEESQSKLFKCYICYEMKPGSEFYFSGHRTTGVGTQCKSCVQQRLKSYGIGSEHNVRNYGRKKMAGHKMKRDAVAGGCIACGEKEPCCLHFHHLDPSTKEVGFARIFSVGSRNLFEKEMAKGVVVLCANCHAKVHAGIITLSPPSP